MRIKSFHRMSQPIFAISSSTTAGVHLPPLKLVTVAIVDSLQSATTGFNVRNYFDIRKSGLLLYAPTLSSTQSIIFENSAVLPEGTVCVADQQVSGRGRGSNEWASPPGCLMFTFLGSTTDGRTLPLIQYIVCIAIIKAIKSCAGFENVDVAIKWPNDIYVNRKIKIGGILCQSVFVDGKFKVSIGVGLNVDNAEPTVCLNQLGSVKVSRAEVLARFLNMYDELYLDFQQNGFEESLQAKYEAAWLHSNQVVKLDQHQGKEVTIKGIVPSSGGCLLAIDSEGNKLELYPDGNRLDFFQGLISKKMDRF